MTTKKTDKTETTEVMVRREPDPGPHVSFNDLVAMGQALVPTGFMPKHVRNGAQFAAIVLAGRELGMQPMRALRSLTLVSGKVVEGADSQLARFKADGGSASFPTLTDTEATIKVRHRNGDEHTETFTIADAKKAGLLSNPTWAKYPKAMLRSRAITAALKSVGWDGAVGAYDPDEARGFVDAEVEVAAEPERVELVEKILTTPHGYVWIHQAMGAADDVTSLAALKKCWEDYMDIVRRHPKDIGPEEQLAMRAYFARAKARVDGAEWNGDDDARARVECLQSSRQRAAIEAEASEGVAE